MVRSMKKSSIAIFAGVNVYGEIEYRLARKCLCGWKFIDVNLLIDSLPEKYRTKYYNSYASQLVTIRDGRIIEPTPRTNWVDPPTNLKNAKLCRLAYIRRIKRDRRIYKRVS